MRTLIMAIVGVMCSLSVAHSDTQTYELDPAHSTVAFLVEHVGFARTLGRFTDTRGSFKYDSDTGELSEVNIVVKTSSVASDHKARDKHIRSKDFLHVKKHPEMIFSTTGTTTVVEQGVEVIGTLSLRGQSQPLTLNTVLNKSDKYPFGHRRFTLGISATATLKRSAYGMNYAVANGLVGDDVDIIIEIEALQKK